MSHVRKKCDIVKCQFGECNKWCAAFLVLWFVAGGFGSPIRHNRPFVDDKVQKYLMNFGYLPQSDIETGNLRTDEQLTEAIKTLQRFGGIEVTGHVDEATKKLLHKPRCGLPDTPDGSFSDPSALGNHPRAKRYTLQGQTWAHTNLTWSLRTQRPQNLDRNAVRHQLSRALDVWAQHSRLTFQEVDSDSADILVYFFRGYHGDGYNFDGRGDILAHAFFPGTGRGGDAHFDEDELWLTHDPEEEEEGTSLFNVAAHEFGHSLGLSHSSVEGSLMYPWYQGMPPNFELPEDDRHGIQQMYGSKETKMWGNIPRFTTTTTTTTTQRPRNPDRYPNHYPEGTYPRRKDDPGRRVPERDYPDRTNPREKNPQGYPDRGYPDRGYPDRGYPDRGYPDRGYPNENYPKKPTRHPNKHPEKHPQHYPHPPTKYPNHPQHPNYPHYPNHPQNPPERTPFHNHPNYNPDKKFSNYYPTAKPQPNYPITSTEDPYKNNPHRPTIRTRITHKHRQSHPKDSSLPPDKCNTSYDAIAVIRQEVFIFKDEYLWRIGDNGLYEGYPAQIKRMWNGLPDNFTHVDAVYERPDKKIVFFIDNVYYLYNGNDVERGYPKPLTNLGLPKSLEKIDGALVWGHNGKTYLFSGTMYWRLDEEHGKVEMDYPRDMNIIWRGVQYNIDTVFQWKDGKTYFFKDKGFWRFNDLKLKVDNEKQIPSATFWMGCTEIPEEPYPQEVPLIAPKYINSSSIKFLLSYEIVLLSILISIFNLK